MSTHLSIAEMFDLQKRHARAEFEDDFDGIMKTIRPDPCFIMEPTGQDITTFAGVEEMYRRLAPYQAGYSRAESINLWFGEDGTMSESRVYRPMPDGSVAVLPIFAGFVFTDDLITSEISYLDMAFADIITQNAWPG